MKNEQTYFCTMESPIGRLTLTCTDEGLGGVFMENHRGATAPEPDWITDRARLRDAMEQLRGYFAGERLDFDVPLHLRGTPFQVEVWNALRTIPYGETRSYSDLARQIGNPNAVRAVGLANGRNPVSIIVPCHRVIGADGSLTGYGGGLDRKRFLLNWEAKVAARPLTQAALL